MKTFSVKNFLALALIAATNMAFQCESTPYPFPEGESNYCSNVDWLKAIVEPVNSETEWFAINTKANTYT